MPARSASPARTRPALPTARAGASGSPASIRSRPSSRPSRSPRTCSSTRSRPSQAAGSPGRRCAGRRSGCSRTGASRSTSTLDAARLTVEQRQIVEIARALLQGTRFIILDEPTAQLEGREVARLFERIVRLQEGGVTFLYISHHLEEIYEVCRSVTVLRDGAGGRQRAARDDAQGARGRRHGRRCGRGPRAGRTAASRRPTARRVACLEVRGLCDRGRSRRT